MTTYADLRNLAPALCECFHAFNDRQMNEGLEKTGLSRSTIVHYGYGLYGSKAGITKYLQFYDNIDKQIAAQCTPQEVYDAEYDNHECDYNQSDTAAMVLVLGIFSVSKASTIDRRNAVLPVEEIYSFGRSDYKS